MKQKINGVATALLFAFSSLKVLLYAVVFAVALTMTVCSVAAIEYGVQLDASTWFFSILAVTFITPLIPGKRIKGALFAGLYREAWDKEIIKRFNDADNTGWRQGIRDIGKYFSMLQDGETVVVNLTYFGVSPDVLINNTSYPLAIQALDGENVAVTVNKFQTKATPVTDDEVVGLNYDKIRTVQESHAIKIEEEKNSKALHSVAPASNVAATPVLLTTGDLVSGRRMMIKKDLLTLRDKVNRLLHPRAGRRLILCNDHINDLLQQDEKFAEQYYNRTTGAIYNTVNFELFESNTNPYFNATTLAKLAYAAVPTPGTHTEASVYFHMQRVVQGKGFSKAYLSASANDPLYQRTLLNYRHYDIVVPYRTEGIAAIASNVV